MYDPHRDPRNTLAGAGSGIVSVFLPQSQVGCLAGLFVLLLLGVLVGLFEGIWLAVAVIALVGLVPLVLRAIKREIRREDQPGPRNAGQEGSLPDDSQLSDEERRDAMRRYRDERDE